MEENQKRLILIAEGAAHTVEYFHKNKVYPGAVVFEATKFREMSPYLTKDDDILVVVKGLTDFTMAEIYALINDLEEAEDKLHNITIMSNVDLGKIPTEYYLYSGDLFYGSVKVVKNNKHYDIEEVVDTEIGGKVSKKDKKSKTTATSNLPKVHTINSVMQKYKEYAKSNVQFKVYGSTKRVAEPTHELDSVTNKLINVNLFEK